MALAVSDDIPLYTSVAQITDRLRFQPQLAIADENLGSIVAKYELPEDKANWTECGWNGCDEPHRFGFVISDKQGRETTCGNRCALTKGGVVFKEVIARLKLAEEVQAQKKVVSELLTGRTESEAAVHATADAVNVALYCFSAFKEHFRPLWRQLEDAAKGGGVVRAAIKRSEWSLNIGKKEELEAVARVAGYKAITSDGPGLATSLRLARQWYADVLVAESLMVMDHKALKIVVREADRYREQVMLGKEYASNVALLIGLKNVRNFEAIVDRVLRTSAMSTAREAVESWPKVHAKLVAQNPAAAPWFAP